VIVKKFLLVGLMCMGSLVQTISPQEACQQIAVAVVKGLVGGTSEVIGGAIGEKIVNNKVIAGSCVVALVAVAYYGFSSKKDDHTDEELEGLPLEA
jgi:hypothetical protein